MFTRTIRKFAFVASLLLLPPIIFTACGGSGSGGTSSNPGIVTNVKTTIQQFFGAMPGFHGTLRTVQAFTEGSSSSFTANAQTTTTIVYTGNYTGFCQSAANGQTFVLYGLGRYTDSNCATNYQNFVNPTDGEPVIGAGSLANLVVLGDGGSGAQSGLVTVYVNGRATALTTTLGTSKRAQNTATTVPVNDGDYVAALFMSVPGDNFQNIRVYIGKQ